MAETVVITVFVERYRYDMAKRTKRLTSGEDESNEIRINKFLSDSGVCSRREADRYIIEGKVKIDGQIAQMGSKVARESVVTFLDKPVKREEKLVLIAFNKPEGIVCTTDQKEPDNIIDFIKYGMRIYPIGRLDKDSDGLILLTNDGNIVNKILRAEYQHEKEYIVRVNKEITAEFLQGMSSGVPILDTVTSPCTVTQLDKNTFNIILTQGLNRQIRRMCEYFGFRVVTLTRIRIMNIQLGRLKTGDFRNVTEKEIEELSQTFQQQEEHRAEKPKYDASDREKSGYEKIKRDKPKDGKMKYDKVKYDKNKVRNTKPGKVDYDKSKAENTESGKDKYDKSKAWNTESDKGRYDKSKTGNKEPGKGKYDKSIYGNVETNKGKYDKSKSVRVGSGKGKYDKNKSVSVDSDKAKLDKSKLGNEESNKVNFIKARLENTERDKVTKYDKTKHEKTEHNKGKYGKTRLEKMEHAKSGYNEGRHEKPEYDQVKDRKPQYKKGEFAKSSHSVRLSSKNPSEHSAAKRDDMKEIKSEGVRVSKGDKRKAPKGYSDHRKRISGSKRSKYK